MSKVNVYASTAQTRADGTTIFWRTGKGSHRHASAFCANSKRAIMTGDVTVIDPAEATSWSPCVDCCSDADVLTAQREAADKAAAMCRNSGIKHPGRGRLYSDCVDCGKTGRVGSNGRIRAHKPQPVS